MESKVPHGYVYRITNLINKKTYIGRRNLSCDRSWRGYMGSGVLVQQAIQKYGVDNFVKSLVAYAFDSQSLQDLEVQAIIAEKDVGRGEYNIHSGSCGGNYFAKLPFEDQLRIRRQISKKVKRARALETENASHRIAEENYSSCVTKLGPQILKLYEQLQSSRKVASELGVSSRYVRRYLDENNVALTCRNVAGFRQSIETRKKISRTQMQKTLIKLTPIEQEAYLLKEGKKVIRVELVCKNSSCHKSFLGKASQQCCSVSCSSKMREKRKQKNFDYELIYDLYWNQNLSRREIGERLGIGRSTVGNVMSRLGVPTRSISESQSGPYRKQNSYAT